METKEYIDPEDLARVLAAQLMKATQLENDQHPLLWDVSIRETVKEINQALELGMNLEDY